MWGVGCVCVYNIYICVYICVCVYVHTFIYVCEKKLVGRCQIENVDFFYLPRNFHFIYKYIYSNRLVFQNCN